MCDEQSRVVLSTHLTPQPPQRDTRGDTRGDVHTYSRQPKNPPATNNHTELRRELHGRQPQGHARVDYIHTCTPTHMLHLPFLAAPHHAPPQSSMDTTYCLPRHHPKSTARSGAPSRQSSGGRAGETGCEGLQQNRYVHGCMWDCGAAAGNINEGAWVCGLGEVLYSHAQGFLLAKSTSPATGCVLLSIHNTSCGPWSRHTLSAHVHAQVHAQVAPR
jgi:hypothetical protein